MPIFGIRLRIVPILLLIVSLLISNLFWGGSTLDELRENGGFSLKLLERAVGDARARVDNFLIAQADMLVWKDGRVLLSERVGFEDAASGTPLSPGRIFRTASMSKPVTAAAVMLQVEAGAVRLTDPVSRFIPEFADMRVAVFDEGGSVVSSVPADREITVFDLLTHSSGLGTGASAASQGGYMPEKDKTLAQIVPRFAQTLLEFQPGTRCEYSALMAFDTLGYIVELTSGLPFDRFLTEKIFVPLGMRDTFFNPTAEQLPRIVKLYASTGDGFDEVNLAPTGSVMGGIPTAYFCGAGGLFSTVADYLRFARMLLNGGELDGVRIMSEESANLMTAARISGVPGANGSEAWGLGMRVVVGARSVLTRGSYGWSGAYGTHFWVDPANDMICLFFSNMTTTGGAGAPAADEFEENVMRALILNRRPV